LNEAILNYDDLLIMLDELLKENARFNWDAFYSERERKIPFFVHFPDENLVNYFEEQQIRSGNVLELGCGHGRNAIYFAEKGCKVDAVDSSQKALKWAKEKAKEKNVEVNFIEKNIFELNITEGKYDLVYDSGCFHHIAPHRRMNYLDLVKKALKPNGLFAITCFIEGGELGGAEISDWEVYRLRSLRGGLGFTEEKLRKIFRDFEITEIRNMKERELSDGMFGVSGLLTALFRKK
jgi:cyclopropane fatty-acyl-phospholipid synthase-like methyltransferase